MPHLSLKIWNRKQHLNVTKSLLLQAINIVRDIARSGRKGRGGVRELRHTLSRVLVADLQAEAI